MKTLPCPIAGCGLDAVVEGVMAEESWLPLGTLPKRKPLALQRTYWVRCAVHGRRMLPRMGGHVTIGNGEKARRARANMRRNIADPHQSIRILCQETKRKLSAAKVQLAETAAEFKQAVDSRAPSK